MAVKLRSLRLVTYPTALVIACIWQTDLGTSKDSLAKQPSIALRNELEHSMRQPCGNCCRTRLAAFNTIDAHAPLLVTIMVYNRASPSDEVLHTLITIAESTRGIVYVSRPTEECEIGTSIIG